MIVEWCSLCNIDVSVWDDSEFSYLIGQQGELAGIVGVIVIQDLGLSSACDRELRLLHSQGAGPLAGRGNCGSRRWRSRQESRGDGVGADSSGGEGGTDSISTPVLIMGDKWRIWVVKERPVLEISYRKTEDLLHPHTYSVAFISGNYDKISLSTNLYHMTETQRKWWSRDKNYYQIYNATLLTNKNGTKCGLQDKTLLKYLFIFVNQNETRK